MLAFLIGLVVGGCFGAVFMSVLVVAGDADRRTERYYDETLDR